MKHGTPFDDGVPVDAYLRERAREIRRSEQSKAFKLLKRTKPPSASSNRHHFGEGSMNWHWATKAILTASSTLSDDSCFAQYGPRAIELLLEEGRLGKISAFIILPNGEEKSLPAKWWRGSEASDCLSGTVHPDGELRIRNVALNDASGAVAVVALKDQDRKGDKGGRLEIREANELRIRLGAKLHADGLPDGGAKAPTELVRYCQEYAAQEGWSERAEETYRKLVGQVLKAHREAISAREKPVKRRS